MSKNLNAFLDHLYNKINNESNERVCKGITQEACKHTPENYFIILLSTTLTKLGDTLSNPKTVLAWVMNYVNAPVFLISFIVPIRESGSMLPQIFLTNYIKQFRKRKYLWVVGSILQFLSIVSIGLVALSFENAIAGWLIIVLLIIFSLSRSICSVSSKDVLGKTIPKTRRGKLKGYTASFSGVLTLLAGLYIFYKTQQDTNIVFYASILFFAAIMWLLAAVTFTFIKEFPNDKSEKSNNTKSLYQKLKLVKKDAAFRNFVITRSLLLCSALTAPYYIVLAQKYLGKQNYILGLFIIAGGLAAIISAPVWGKMADKSSKKVMSIAATITSILGFLFFLIIQFFPSLRSTTWLYPLSFFILGIAHSGVRLGRKTYVVDMATGDQRTEYVAISNTIIGFVLMITGGISAIISNYSAEWIILLLSLLCAIGVITSFNLPEVQGTE